MGSWTSRWILEGDFISYIDQTIGMTRYYFVRRRDFAHLEWEFGWPEVAEEDRPIAPGQIGGPYTFQQIKPTKWSEATNQGQIFQLIFGIKPNVFVYIQLPSDTKRHGTPKLPWHKRTLRKVAHFTMQMSPYDRPTFFTEHFLVPKLCDLAGFEAYNPLDKTVLPYLNFYINKLEVEWVGDVAPDGTRTPSSGRYADVLENLYRRVAKFRPITLESVRAAAAQR